jgi:hydrogenase maturation protease
MAHILIAGMGNIFLGDDGFGCEVVSTLASAALPSGVKVIDYGIRGLDLTYALLEPYDLVILVDAIMRGEAPGTLYLLEPAGEAASDVSIDPHSMDPLRLLAVARSLGEVKARIIIVGCEPEDFGDDLEGRMGLSLKVNFSVAEGVRMVLDVVASLSVTPCALLTSTTNNQHELHQGDRS